MCTDRGQNLRPLMIATEEAAASELRKKRDSGERTIQLNRAQPTEDAGPVVVEKVMGEDRMKRCPLDRERTRFVQGGAPSLPLVPDTNSLLKFILT
jgi:hypothetical protein